jgi:hypothetical protein
MNVLVQEIYDRIFEYQREDLSKFLKEEKKLNEKQIECILGIRFLSISGRFYRLRS